MLIGVPREIKTHEYRVGLTPASVRRLVERGHGLIVERQAGVGIGAADEDYAQAGARLVDRAEDVFAQAEMIVKVKEPQAIERARLRPGQVLFTYLHLAPDADQCRDLMASGAVCIGYETVTAPDGSLPLLAPMSAVAGRMSIQVAAHWLERPQGGRGVLLGGVAGVSPARLVILGAGVAGVHAAHAAVGAGADVIVFDRSAEALRRLESTLGGRTRGELATPERIEAEVLAADAVIGAVLVRGAAAPRLVTRAMVSRMAPGAVLVDIAIDQGGCFETSRPTTHADPTYTVDGVIRYAVANMPGAVPRTSTQALNAATLTHVMALADKGWRQALRDDPHLRNGLNVAHGRVTCREVAEALGHEHHDAASVLAG
jgi:alanine dehydrogenase